MMTDNRRPLDHRVGDRYCDDRASSVSSSRSVMTVKRKKDAKVDSHRSFSVKRGESIGSEDIRNVISNGAAEEISFGKKKEDVTSQVIKRQIEKPSSRQDKKISQAFKRSISRPISKTKFNNLSKILGLPEFLTANECQKNKKPEKIHDETQHEIHLTKEDDLLSFKAYSCELEEKRLQIDLKPKIDPSQDTPLKSISSIKQIILDIQTSITQGSDVSAITDSIAVDSKGRKRYNQSKTLRSFSDKLDKHATAIVSRYDKEATHHKLQLVLIELLNQELECCYSLTTHRLQVFDAIKWLLICSKEVKHRCIYVVLNLGDDVNLRMAVHAYEAIVKKACFVPDIDHADVEDAVRLTVAALEGRCDGGKCMDSVKVRDDFGKKVAALCSMHIGKSMCGCAGGIWARLATDEGARKEVLRELKSKLEQKKLKNSKVISLKARLKKK